MIFCGIDPGLSGGIVFIQGNEILSFHEMPTLENELSVVKLHEIFNGSSDFTLVLEKQIAMPKQSSTSTYTTGRNFGVLEGVIKSVQITGNKTISLHYVMPRTWSMATHKTVSLPKDTDNKIKTLQAMQQRYNLPKEFFKKTGKAKDGLVDALAIATWFKEKT